MHNSGQVAPFSLEFYTCNMAVLYNIHAVPKW